MANEELLKKRAEIQAQLDALLKEDTASPSPAQQIELAKTAGTPVHPLNKSVKPDYSMDPQSLFNVEPNTEAMSARQQLMNIPGADAKMVNTFIQSQKQILPIGQMVGEEAGAVAGAAIGGKVAGVVGQIPPLTALPEESFTVPIGTFLGGVIGAGLGGAAGEAAQEAIDPRLAVDMFDIKRAGLESAIWEGGGRLAFGAIQKIGPSMLPGGKNPVTSKVQDAKDIFSKQGGFLTANQEDINWWRNSWESLVAETSAGRKQFDMLNDKQKEQLVAYGLDMVNRMADDAIASVGGATGMEITKGKLAREIDSILAARGGTRKALIDDIVEPSYKSISIRSNAKFPTDDILDFIEDELKRDKRVRHLSPQGRSEAKELRTLLMGDELAQATGETVEYSIDEMRQFRSARIADSQRFQGLGDKSSAFFDKLSKKADEALFNPENALGLPEELAMELRDLNTFYATTRQMYDDSIVIALAKKIDDKPEEVLNVLFKSYDPERVSRLKETITKPTVTKIRDKVTTTKDVSNEVSRTLDRIMSPDVKTSIIANNTQGEALWKKINGYWLADAINNSVDKNGKFVSGKFKEAWESLPTKTKKMMFPKDFIKEINRFDNAVQVHTMSHRMAGPELIGRRAEQIGGALTVGGVMSGASKGLTLGKGIAIGSGGMLLLSPGTASKLMTSKAGNRLLKAGWTAIPGSPEVATTAARMVRLIAEQESADEKETKRKERQEGLRAKMPAAIKAIR